MSWNTMLPRILSQGIFKGKSPIVISQSGLYSKSCLNKSISSLSLRCSCGNSGRIGPGFSLVKRLNTNSENSICCVSTKHSFKTVENHQHRKIPFSNCYTHAHFSSRWRNFQSSIENAKGVKTSSARKAIRFELREDDAQLVLYSGDDEESRNLPLIWLRDHCRCQSCYNHTTNQRDNVNLDLFDPDSGRVRVHSADFEDGDATLAIHWKDNHVSKYPVDWLMGNSYISDKGSHYLASPVKRVLWDGERIKNRGGPLSVSFASHVETEEGLRQTLSNLLEYGFAVITEAPVSLEGVKMATDRVAPIQDTFYGGLWQFTSDGSFSDSAFSTGFLAAHTDNSYLEMPAGIQVFQCLGHDGKGGETLLVDGFHAVEKLRQSHPDSVRFLSSHLVPHEYRESPGRKGDDSCRDSPGYHMYTLCPVIRLHPATGEILNLRFNPYDRAPLNTICPEETQEFYRSYHLLSTNIADPKAQFWMKLNPGTILLIDNWRVLHGRSAFDGQRIMCGCYLRRDDWLSKARIMGLARG